MLMWTTNGFVIVELGVDRRDGDFESAETAPAGQASGVTQSAIENLFATQIHFVVEGVRCEVAPRF